MSEPREPDGWSPPDPGVPGGRSAEPTGEDRLPEFERPQPSWQGVPSPGQQDPYNQDPHAQDPRAQAYVQAPHGPGPYPQPYGVYGAQPARTPWIAAPPAGVPFHRMARTDAHRWWRPLLGTVAIAGVGIGMSAVLLLAGTIVALAVTGEMPETSGADDTTIFGNDIADLVFNLAAIAVFLPVVLFAAWGIQRRRPGTLSSIAGRLRWKWMLVCSGLAILYTIVAFGTSFLAGLTLDDQSADDGQWVGWGEFLGPTLIIILLVPFQASAEEYMFRGWLLQAVGACTLENAKRKAGRALSVVFRTPWPGIVVGSALFTMMHGYTGWGMLDIFAFGAITGWLAVRTGGLEAPIALHVFNNLLAFIVSAALGQLEIVQGSVPWQVVVADLFSMLLFAAGAVWLARRMRIQTVTPAPAEDGAPAAGTDPARVP
ncbi:type II CAAX prenyl endopeptidase Rce1 family protein [Actinomadura welshii]